MKNLISKILFLISVLSFGQKPTTPANSANPKGSCNPILADCHRDKDTCMLSVLYKHPYIAVPCGRVTSFCISLPANGIFVDKMINGNHLTDDALYMLKDDKYDCYILIKNVNYQTDDGSTKTARGMLIRILKK